jgi:hypothetical protein
MDAREWWSCFGQACPDLILLLLQFIEPVEHRALVAAIFDGVEDGFDAALGFGECRLVLNSRQLTVVVECSQTTGLCHDGAPTNHRS